MPTAEDIVKNGQPLGEIQVLQQQKIEELVLYNIQLNEKLNSLMIENKRLIERVEKLENKEW